MVYTTCIYNIQGRASIFRGRLSNLCLFKSRLGGLWVGGFAFLLFVVHERVYKGIADGSCQHFYSHVFHMMDMNTNVSQIHREESTDKIIGYSYRPTHTYINISLSLSVCLSV